ncbi:hypothetical protein E0K89_002965 [Aquicoccus sp. SCR17]|nr:hypothetical protein [Carideicomes alvinocaridis]
MIYRPLGLMAGLVLLPASAALAEEVSFAATIAANAAYDTDGGLSYSGASIEGSGEMSYYGFHTGLWFETLPDDPADNAEIELSFGYTGALPGEAEWDVTYTRYYLDESGYQGHDIALGLGAPITGRLSGAVAAIYEPEGETVDFEAALEFAATDKWTFSALAGKSEADDNLYTELGAGYALTDQVTVGALYEDADDTDGTLTFSVSYAFGG